MDWHTTTCKVSMLACTDSSLYLHWLMTSHCVSRIFIWTGTIHLKPMHLKTCNNSIFFFFKRQLVCSNSSKCTFGGTIFKWAFYWIYSVCGVGSKCTAVPVFIVMKEHVTQWNALLCFQLYFGQQWPSRNALYQSLPAQAILVSGINPCCFWSFNWRYWQCEKFRLFPAYSFREGKRQHCLPWAMHFSGCP